MRGEYKLRAVGDGALGAAEGGEPAKRDAIEFAEDDGMKAMRLERVQQVRELP